MTTYRPLRALLALAALALALALVGAALPAASASAASSSKIIEDCSDDGALQGKYRPGELRKARQSLPTDIDEYSDCRDVLRRAELSASHANNDKDSSNDSDSTSGGAPQRNDADGGNTPAPGTTTDDGRQLLSPKDEADVDRLVETLKRDGDKPISLDGKVVHPGKAAAVSGTGDVPGPLVLVLVLLGATAVGSGVMLARNRVLGRRAS